MGNADEIGDVLLIETQMPSIKQDSIDYAITRLRRVLNRMNLYGEKVQNLRRQLEESGKSVKLLQQHNMLLETVHREKRLQQAIDSTSDALPYHTFLWNYIEGLDNRLESLLQQLEQLLDRRRMVDVGVQTDGGQAEQPSSGQHKSWWLEAAVALCSASVFLMIGGLLNSVWSGGMDKVVIHIGPNPL